MEAVIGQAMGVVEPMSAALCPVPCAYSLFMGNIELPGGATGGKQTIKMPVGTYEFGANLISEKGVSPHGTTYFEVLSGCIIFFLSLFSTLHNTATTPTAVGLVLVTAVAAQAAHQTLKSLQAAGQHDVCSRHARMVTPDYTLQEFPWCGCWLMLCASFDCLSVQHFALGRITTDGRLSGRLK
jgi:hypothetical protein